MRSNPNIEVGILLRKNISFNLSGDYVLNNSKINFSGKCEAIIDQNQLVLIYKDEKIVCPNGVKFIPLNISENHFEVHKVVIGIDFHWEQEESQKFQGTLKLMIIDGLIQVINIVPIENYLYSVISSEMNANSSINLLKAHTIISRSWLIAQINAKEAEQKEKDSEEINGEYIKWFDQEDHKHFHVCADDHCQRYQGISRSLNPNVIQSVNETKGMVLIYENKICDARFSKSCGGHTELYENCWDETSHPYLKDFPDIDTDTKVSYDLKKEEDAKNFILNAPNSFCNTNDKHILSQVLNDYDQTTTDFYRWKVEYKQEEISALIQKKSAMNFGKILGFQAIERGESGRLIKLKIIGSEKELIIGKELLIRKWLSESHLYSSAIIIEPGEIKNGIPESYTIHGSGWGHGVGLCQIGAAVMGEKNYDYKEILKHYYRGAIIEKHYS